MHTGRQAPQRVQCTARHPHTPVDVTPQTWLTGYILAMPAWDGCALNEPPAAAVMLTELTQRLTQPRHTDGPTPPPNNTNRQKCDRDPATSFLTAATLIYAIGAGITAAAGTRLALQWILVKGFKVDSFQLQGLERVLYCYFSSLPPRVGSG